MRAAQPDRFLGSSNYYRTAGLTDQEGAALKSIAADCRAGDSGIVPTTGEINGYARTVDYGEFGETGLRADATLSDPNGNTVAYDSDSAYGEADAYVWWEVGSFYGGYEIQGAHWYYIEDDYMEGGDWLQYTHWSVWAEPQPVIFSPCGGAWRDGAWRDGAWRA